jgi:hypothetical protein
MYVFSVPLYMVYENKDEYIFYLNTLQLSAYFVFIYNFTIMFCDINKITVL